MNNVSIALHGGIGLFESESLSGKQAQAIEVVLKRAVQAGHQILLQGGKAMDAVVASVRILEDSPWFNAAKGGVLNRNEMVEMDAGVMCGESRQTCSVVGLRHIEHPVSLANDLLTSRGPGIFMGDGAEKLAIQQGYDYTEQDVFFTDARYVQLEHAQGEPVADDVSAACLFEGAVGAIALDQYGNIAAASSSAGKINHHHGQVSEAGIRGSSFYAENGLLAVIATASAPHMMAEDVMIRMRYHQETLPMASEQVFRGTLVENGGAGGLLAMDAQGHLSCHYQGMAMPRASIDLQGCLSMVIFDEE